MTATLSGELVAALWNKCDMQHTGSFGSGCTDGGGGDALPAMVGGFGKDGVRILFSRSLNQKRAASHVFFSLAGYFIFAGQMSTTPFFL